jgi:hypothetical protein
MKKCFRTELAILAEIDEKELKLPCFDMTVKSLSVSRQIKITSEEASVSCPHLFRFNNANDFCQPQTVNKSVQQCKSGNGLFALPSSQHSQRCMPQLPH